MTNWRYTLDIKPLLNHATVRWDDRCRETQAAIVDLLKNSRDYAGDFELQQITEELGDADELSWFNAVLDGLYGWADDNQVWMGL